MPRQRVEVVSLAVVDGRFLAHPAISLIRAGEELLREWVEHHRGGGHAPTLRAGSPRGQRRSNTGSLPVNSPAQPLRHAAASYSSRNNGKDYSRETQMTATSSSRSLFTRSEREEPASCTT